MKAHLLLASLLFPTIAIAAPEKVFNGTGLEGWKVQGADYWTVAEGVLKGESDDKKQNSVLWSEKSFKDFTVELDFKFSGDVDSGIFLRHENEQIQIGTSRSLKRDLTASPYIGSKRGYPQEAAGVKELLKADDWNHMKIVAKGKTYTVSLNGEQVIEYVSDTAKESGPIGLQIHPGVKMKIEFKNLTVDSL
ncbi:DUF1080 domain-containing protein [Luteolibacter sp. GHJ8]|uniref:DUF1080 domain-containing protein n=1 Tax=Luteolibacter rhizosphaerae TaxID=2989719 RepID=A0ABT3G8H0_9BACT|nr:DUF1080 domain-containing protein [Luteolibacter rhizosphaerae]MCW1916153.1 DUF1080 domain-containing protein [Luteolibacter rhizosphaerae]